jgi:O-antigen/teichoic acid export membrane protein
MKTIYKVGLWILIILGILYALQLGVALVYLWVPIILLIIYLLIYINKKMKKKVWVIGIKRKIQKKFLYS